jgi:hypothetical protein
MYPYRKQVRKDKILYDNNISIKNKINSAQMSSSVYVELC